MRFALVGLQFWKDIKEIKRHQKRHQKTTLLLKNFTKNGPLQFKSDADVSAIP